jgi:hypothetical protein
LFLLLAGGCIKSNLSWQGLLKIISYRNVQSDKAWIYLCQNSKKKPLFKNIANIVPSGSQDKLGSKFTGEKKPSIWKAEKFKLYTVIFLSGLSYSCI